MRLLELSVRSHFLSTLSARIFENANIATIGLHFVGFLKVRRRPRFENLFDPSSRARNDRVDRTLATLMSRCEVQCSKMEDAITF